MTTRTLTGFLVVGAALVAAPAFAQGDAHNGETLFGQRCGSCHTVTPDMQHGFTGPNLFGVSDRAAGTVPGWDFSQALKDSKIVWTDENLDKWLTDTTALVPGAQMNLKVPSKAEREDIIAYLKSLKPKK